MSRRRVLLLLKPLDVYPPRPKPLSPSPLHAVDSKILHFLDDRCRVHKETINFCQHVLRRKSVDWEPLLRNSLFQRIHHVDLVITVGGDGTLLRASHFLDDSIPVLGVNSDPTRAQEVDEFSNAFDATRSTGYLCAATAENFEQVLDDVLEGGKVPFDLTRMSLNLNTHQLSTYVLNDILLAHSCPATVSRFSFSAKRVTGKCSLVICRSSGLRVSTAAGSTAAMLSAGGFPMPVLNRDLQYMVREPILPRDVDVPAMHGFLHPDETMQVTWSSSEGNIYIDGSHVTFSIRYGDSINISSKAPVLKVYLPQSLLLA